MILEHILKLECPHLNVPKGPVAQEDFYSKHIKEKESNCEVSAPKRALSNCYCVNHRSMH